MHEEHDLILAHERKGIFIDMDLAFKGLEPICWS